MEGRGVTRPERSSTSVRRRESAGFRLTPDPLDDPGRRIPALQLHAHDAAAPRPDVVAADDGLRPPVGSLHENVGFQAPDRLERGLLAEDRDVIHATQRGHHDRAIACRNDRPAGALRQSPYRAVAVDAHDEEVAETLRGLEKRHVAGVEEVEDAVREDDPLALAAQLRAQRSELRAGDHFRPGFAFWAHLITVSRHGYLPSGESTYHGAKRRLTGARGTSR